MHLVFCAVLGILKNKLYKNWKIYPQQTQKSQTHRIFFDQIKKYQNNQKSSTRGRGKSLQSSGAAKQTAVRDTKRQKSDKQYSYLKILQWTTLFISSMALKV